MPDATIKILSLDLIVRDDKVNPRKKLDIETISDYRQMYTDASEAKRKCELPILRVFLLPDGKYYLTRGFHRITAAEEAKRSSLEFEIFEGSRSDAIVDASADNHKNGRRPTADDKRKSVCNYLDDPTLCKLSQAMIAEKTEVSLSLVKTIMRERREQRDDTEPKPKSGPRDKDTHVEGDVEEPQVTTESRDGKTRKRHTTSSKGGAKAVGAAAKKAVTDDAAKEMDLEGIADELHDRLRELLPTAKERKSLTTYEDAEQVKICRLINGTTISTLGEAIVAYNADKTPVPRTRDVAKREIPEHLLDVMNDTWFADAEKALKDIAKQCKTRLQMSPYFIGDLGPLVENIEEYSRKIGDCQPKCVCPECKGDTEKMADCGWCKMTGWMPAWAFKDWKLKKGT